ncbi:MAG: Gfo/Idh/MocA family oxidoreductase [Myxococcota bacterium]
MAEPRICVVGAGRWGQNHVRTLSELGCLAGFVDSDPARREQIAARHPEARAFESLEVALASRPDGFVVATPPESHGRIAERIMEAGHPVLVEKPLALTADEARHMAATATRCRVPLMVGHVLLFHPAIRRIKEWLDAGRLGRLQYVYSNRLNLGTVRTEENILWSFAPHDVSIFQHLVGARPLEVVSRGGAFLQPRIQDSTLTILTYPRNIVGHIFVSWLHPYKEHRLVLIGSRGMLSFDDASETKELLFYEKGIDWIEGEPIKRDGPTETIPYDREMPLTEELRYFIDHLQGPPAEVAGPESAIEVLEILERATRSLVGESGEPTGEDAAEGHGRGTRIHASSFVDPGAEVGEGTRIWHFCHVQAGARIGRRCTLGQNVNVAPHAIIGDDVRIQNNVSVYEGVELEDWVFCGPSVVFTNVRSPRAEFPRKGREAYERTRVGRGTTLGANSTIVCGVTLGAHSFVAAGAVVAADTPAHALVAGVPARRIGWACACGQKLCFEGASSTCTRCPRRYRRESDDAIRLVEDDPAGSAG